MNSIFPDMIKSLPKADVDINGASIYIFQSTDYQLVFMEFENDVILPDHEHGDQWEHGVSGKVDLTMHGITKIYSRGDSFFVPNGCVHSGRIYAGYASIALFNQKNRYLIK